jgi:hypothetical protein
MQRNLRLTSVVASELSKWTISAALKCRQLEGERRVQVDKRDITRGELDEFVREVARVADLVVQVHMRFQTLS